MLEFIRTHQKWMQLLLFVVILPSFLYLGVDSYSKFLDQPTDLVKIGKETILQDQFSKQFTQFLQQEKMQKGSNYDEKQASSIKNKQLVLDQMIASQLSRQEAVRLNVQTNDQKVLDYISQMPLVMNFKKPDGSIDVQKLNQALLEQGMTPQSFQEWVRQLVSLEYLPNNIAQSAFIANTSAKELGNKLAQKRYIQVANFPASQFVDKVVVNDTELSKFFDKNPMQFLQAENVDVEYVTLDKNVLKVAPPTDEQIAQYYSKNQTNFTSQPERSAKHILLKVEGANKAEQEKKAQQILADIQKSNKPAEQFTQLAKMHSQDPGSKDKGGDLGFFARGAMVKTFEDAVFSVKSPGLYPKLVESEFGWHIIYIDAIKPEVTQTLAQARSSIIAKLLEDAQTQMFAQKLEQLNSAVLDNLPISKIAQKIGVELKTAQKVLRKATSIKKPDHKPSVLDDARLLEALFSQVEILRGQRHTDVVQIQQQAVVAHVLHHQKEKMQTFEQAKEDVKKVYIEKQSLVLAKQAGVSQLALAKQGEALNWSQEEVFTRMMSNFPKDLMEAIFNTDTQKLPSYSGLGNDAGYVIFKINKVENVEPDANITRALQAFSGVYGLEETRAVLFDLKKLHHVRQIKPLSEVN